MNALDVSTPSSLPARVPPQWEPFVQQIARLSGDSLTADTQVLFDVTIDGRRYVLASAPAPRLKVSLSPREQEIVDLVAKGFPNKSIAYILDISPCTVATHLRRVFSKLGVSSRAEMVARIGNHPFLARVS